MKIIHCGDLHLDADLRTRLDAAELLNTFRRLCLYANEQGVGAVLICGDLFDTESPSSSSVRTVEDLILENGGILFFYLRGNHDGRTALFKTRKKPDNLFLFGDDWASWELSEEGIRGRRVCIAGREPSGAPFSSPVLDSSCLNIVMLHGQVREGYTGPDPESVPLSALRGCGIDYLALGHLHHYRSFPLDKRGRGAYCGCLEGRGFDECGPCGFILIDTDTPAASPSIRFIPFASRTLYSVDCAVTGCSSDTEIYERISSTAPLPQKKISYACSSPESWNTDAALIPPSSARSGKAYITILNTATEPSRWCTAKNFSATPPLRENSCA